MNFLRRNRRARTDPAYDTTTGTTGNTMQMKSGTHKDRHLRKKEKRQKRPLFDMNSGNFNRRPSFGQW